MSDNTGEEKPKVRPPRGLDGTAVFRMLNFELFVKPNKIVMAFGLVAISSCFGYLFYINQTARNTGTDKYIALNDDGSEFLKEKKSKWD